jgi:O-antigen/teichoic acid export membrane protein
LFYDLVVSSVQAVAFPAFSGAHRAGEDLQAHYLRTVTLISGAVLPVLAMLAILAQPLVRILLGNQWMPSAALVPLLSVGSAMEALAPMVIQFLSATGSVRAVLPIALYTRAAQIAIVGCAANFGIVWVAAGQIALGCISFFVNTRYLRRCATVRIPALLSAAGPSVVVAGVTVILPLAAILIRPDVEESSPWLSLIIGGSLGGIVWLGAIIALDHPLKHELQALFREMLRIVRRRA